MEMARLTRDSATESKAAFPPQELKGKKGAHVTPIANVIVYRAADRLIQRLGSDALGRASRHIELMVDRRDKDRFLLWLRIRQASVALKMRQQGRCISGWTASTATGACGGKD